MLVFKEFLTDSFLHHLLLSLNHQLAVLLDTKSGLQQVLEIHLTITELCKTARI